MSWRNSKTMIVGVASLAVFVDNLVYTMVIPLLPTFKAQYGLSIAEVGYLMGAYASAQLFACFIAGYLVDRFSPRVVLLTGCLWLLAATLLFAFAESYAILLLARFLQGLPAAATWSAALAMLPLNLEPDEQGRATGIVMTFGGIGNLIGPPMSGFLVHLGGDSMPFWVASGAVVLDIIGRLLLDDTPRASLAEGVDEPNAVDDEPNSPPEALKRDFYSEKRPLLPKKKQVSPAPTAKKSGYGALLSDGAMLLFMLVTFVTAFLMNGAEPVLPLIIRQRFDFSPLYLGLTYMSLPIAFVVSSPIVGWLSDRFLTKRRHMLAFGLATSAGMFVPIVLTHNLIVMVASLFFLGFFLSFLTTVSLPCIFDVVDRRHASRLYAQAGSLQNVSWSTGCFVAPMVVALVADRTDNFWAFITMSGVAGASFLFFVVVAFGFGRHWFDGEGVVEAAVSETPQETSGVMLPPPLVMMRSGRSSRRVMSNTNSVRVVDQSPAAMLAGSRRQRYSRRQSSRKPGTTTPARARRHGPSALAQGMTPEQLV